MSEREAAEEPTVGNVKLSDYLKMMKDLFPEAQLKTDDGHTLNYFYEDGNMIIQTPDRSDIYKNVLTELKKAGLSGVWRSKQEGPRA